MHLLGNSHIGRAWRALSTRQEIAATLGIDVPHYKLVALLIAAVMASLAGSFYVAFTHFVGPDLYDISIVINLMFMLFVGGLRSTVGPIVGASFVILVPQLVAGFERYQNLVFFTLLLLVILIWPRSIWHPRSTARWESPPPCTPPRRWHPAGRSPHAAWLRSRCSRTSWIRCRRRKARSLCRRQPDSESIRSDAARDPDPGIPIQ